ncbi:hypothetical protein [Peterkaempfera sp. SMS 1(5)a]|uniref:hypothetical protein n=1 Tax=Peterkaempfera podocarpi TaxID=3232308 RepID=UPI003670E5E9
MVIHWHVQRKNVWPLGAEAVVLDPHNGDPRETCHPQPGWHALATVASHFHPPRTREQS